MPKALRERELQDKSRFSLLRFKSATMQKKKVRYQVCSSTICKTCSGLQVVVLLFLYFTMLHGDVSPVVLKEKKKQLIRLLNEGLYVIVANAENFSSHNL